MRPDPSSKHGAVQVMDYEMFIPIREQINPGEIFFVKIEKLNGDKGNSNPHYKDLASRTSIEVSGITEAKEVMFNYKNDRYNMSQVFTVNLLTYDMKPVSEN